jgi:RNA polymerase sigma factor (sigma-70 family)
MLDCEIVAAIAAGDADALAAAYDRYAAPLYAFCSSLLTEPAAAADAVQDTFVIAAARLAALRDPDCLQPWLYAVARSQCRRRLAARGGSAVQDGPDELTGEPAGSGIDLERAELPEVVGSVIAALGPGEREVIELSLRQGFSSDDLASVLGVSSVQADALAARACGQFEQALAAVLVARSGRAQCARLDELLEGWDGQLTAPLRQRLGRHIQHCRVCSGRKHRELEPAMLVSVLPVMAIARSLREQVLGLVASGSPDAVAYRAGVMLRAGPFGESGFPVLADPPAARRERSRRRAVLAFAAVTALAVLGAVGLEVSQHHGHGPQPATAALGSQLVPSQPRRTLPALGPASHGSSSRARHARAPGTASAAPAVSVSVSPSVSSLVPPASSRPVRSSPPPSPSGTPSPSPSTGTLTA